MQQEDVVPFDSVKLCNAKRPCPLPTKVFPEAKEVTEDMMNKYEADNKFYYFTWGTKGVKDPLGDLKSRNDDGTKSVFNFRLKNGTWEAITQYENYKVYRVPDEILLTTVDNV